MSKFGAGTKTLIPNVKVSIGIDCPSCGLPIQDVSEGQNLLCPDCGTSISVPSVVTDEWTLTEPQFWESKFGAGTKTLAELAVE